MKVVKGKYKKGKIKLEKQPNIDGEVDVIVVFANKKDEEPSVEYEFDFESQAFKEKKQEKKQEKKKEEPGFNFQDFFKDDRFRNIADIIRQAGMELQSEFKKHKRK